MIIKLLVPLLTLNYKPVIYNARHSRRCLQSSPSPACSSGRSFTSTSRCSEGGGLPKPSINYQDIVQNPIYKSHNAFNRRANLPVTTITDIAKLHALRNMTRVDLNTLKSKRTVVGDRVRQGGGGRALALEEAKRLKEEIHSLERSLAKLDDDLLSTALRLPNDTHPDVPLGPESAAKVLSTHGARPMQPTSSRHHVNLNQTLAFMDLEAGAASSGSSWYFLKDIGALLELALVNYAMAVAIKHGFAPVMTPDVVREDVATRCGFQPRDESGSAPSQTYNLNRTKEEPQLVLAGTAEIPLAAMFSGKTLDPQVLPRKVVGLGRAFRAEAGARGADTRGLYRVHQFSKVEMFVVCEGKLETSNAEMAEMKRIQVEIFEGLGLSFRSVKWLLAWLPQL